MYTARIVPVASHGSPKFPLIAVMLAAIGMAILSRPAFAQGPMTNGEDHAGEILATEVDVWTFEATAGDRLVVRIGETGGNPTLNPWLRLLGPTGALIHEGFSDRAVEVTGAASVTGTHRVEVSSRDSGVPGTGGYRITLARMPGSFVVPAGDEGGPMTNGASHEGRNHRGDIDMWSFTATAEDALIVRIGETGGDSEFFPEIRLYSPAGELLSTRRNDQAAEITFSAPLTGTYTVLVATFLDAPGGSYLLTLAKIPGPFVVSSGDQGGPMTNGANHAGRLHVGDLDMWSFTASSGQPLIVRMGEVGGDWLVNPWLRLYGPTGALLQSRADAQVVEVSVMAPLTGTYTVVASTQGGGLNATGRYLITLAKVPGSFVVGDEGGPMTNGENHAGLIHLGDLDMWSFSAAAGDAVILRMTEVDGDSPFHPGIRVYGPTGAPVGVGEASALAMEIRLVPVPITGTYTAIVTTNDGHLVGSGDYTFTLAKIPGAFVVAVGDEGGPMSTGANHPGVSRSPGDLDMWTFTAVAGNAIALRTSEVGGDTTFTPQMRLYGPTGVPRGSSIGDTTTAQINVSAPETGTYTVIVSNQNLAVDVAGSYLLSLLGVPPQFAPILSRTPLSTSSVRLNWTAIGGATSYRLKRGTSPGGQTVLLTTAATSFVDSGLVPGTSYYYVVSAVGAGSETANSNEVSFRFITPPGDFDADLKSDITIFRPSDGTWYTIRSSTGTSTAVAWGNSADKPLVGDFDGDGRTDIAIFRPSNGTWFIIPSTTGAPYAYAWGNSADTPVPGDYDRDGKTDIAVYRPSTGTWYVVPSTTGVPYGFAWGNSADLPVPGDYDGDGKTDIAVFRPSTGTWFVVPSTTGSPYGVEWGNGADVVAPGDYDGDGKTDTAVFRPSNGTWYVIPSTTAVPFATAWGNAADIAVPADYDGDGKTDVAVFRPSNGTWYVIPSTTGVPFATAWGNSADIPIFRRP